ncbi:enoyl-CoA hydratase/isomerase family protein [Streptomyces sp. NPDC001027]|uniref:enoyl-CoA hydratase/isomerase family protein n=1 Tax=Streptomyces sp. NPDC001027 TaxID=3154771 RepID=UPI003331D4D1
MNNTDEQVLLTEISDGLARLTINRAEQMNTLNRALTAELKRTFSELTGNADVRVVLLRAAGDKAFCAGADLKEPRVHTAPRLEECLAGEPGVFDLMRRCRQIIISEVNGWAVGGGMQLALFSDLTFASAGARFKLPQVGLGIIPPYATTSRLARQIGQGRAMQMLLLGTTMGAEDAFRAGLVQGVAADAHALHVQVEDTIRTLLALPPTSLAMAKNSLLSGLEMTSESAAEADRFRDYALKQHKETTLAAGSSGSKHP